MASRAVELFEGGLARLGAIREWTIVHVFDELRERVVELAQLEEGSVAYLRDGGANGRDGVESTATRSLFNPTAETPCGRGWSSAGNPEG